MRRSALSSAFLALGLLLACGRPPTVASTTALPAATTTRQPAAPTQVGFVSLPGYNADVWAYNGYAYVGTTGERVPTRCPASGVRVVDLAEPAHPAVVGAVAAIPRSTQEKVVVRRIDTAAFRGDLLAVGVQACDTPTQDAPRGVDLWDVTNPRQPQHLAFWDSGRGVSGACMNSGCSRAATGPTSRRRSRARRWTAGRATSACST